MVLLAVLQVEQEPDGAYGITVFNELVKRTGRLVARGAVYMTLDRLEKKGLLTSFLTERLAERGGRARRCFRVTKTAVAALRTSRRALDRLWDGLEVLR
jgi:DNA-binding PadR family transcriptional regulator